MIRYYKDIDGQRVYFPGTIIADGMVYTRPSRQQILDDGWTEEEYTPTEPVPVPQSEPDEFAVLQAAKKLLQPQVEQLSDAEALEVEACFPTWESLIGESVTTGKRIWDDGHLWKVIQPHTVSREWRPADTASLYTMVATYPEQGTIDNPIPFEVNMELISGKYYTEDSVLYLCTRDLVAAYWTLANLVGQYVEVVNQ